MELEDIERILDLVRQHELAEFELERDGLKLRVRKATAPAPAVPTAALSPATAPAVTDNPAAPPSSTDAARPLQPPADDESVELVVVKSPIVGTFYNTPEPGAPPFVEVGQRVKKDQVLCIIEAMKLMNEITSEYDGEIVSAYVENGKPVQYGERLFAIRFS
jgi:acetyl-CoA carboxylase biotin carboxyl carrier protein